MSKRNKNAIRTTSPIGDAVIVIFMLCAGVLCILPILNVLAISLSSNAAAASGKVKFWPVDLTFNSYSYALARPQFIRSFAISLERVALGLPINMIFTVLAAYPLSKNRYELTGRTVYAWFFFFTMIFNGGLIPWFIVVKLTGLMDTMWGLVIPRAIQVYYVILLMNFFRQIPRELSEAAYVDGASEIKILFNIYLPLSLPSLATLSLYMVVFHWNDWFDGLILMKNADKYPLQTYLQSVVIERDPNVLMHASVEELKKLAELSNRSLRSAQIFIAALPILALYPFLQKYFMKGLILGGVKG